MSTYLNSQLQATDSPLLPAALYGQGVYTSFRVVDGCVKGLGLHLQRLSYDAQVILGTTVTPEALRSNLREVLANHTAEHTDWRVRYTLLPEMVSLRQPQPEPLLHLITIHPYAPTPLPPLRLKTILLQRSLATHKMSAHIATHLWARQQAQLAGYEDALFVESGEITEGPTWNIIFIDNNQNIIINSSSNSLPGITQKLLIEDAQAAGMTVTEKSMTIPLNTSVTAAFASNAIMGLRPIGQIDDHSLQTEHPLLEKLQTLYRDIVPEAIG